MTYKQIIQELIEVCNQFANLRNTEYMEFEKFETKVQGDDFPFVAVQSNGGIERTLQNIQVHYVDSLNNEQSNLLQIHSDFSAFHNYVYENFKYINSYTWTEYYKVLGQQAAGGVINITLDLSNVC